MPKKSNNGQAATKKDFQLLRSEFKATKESLFSQILALEEKIEQGDDRNKKYKNEILTGLDQVMNELQASPYPTNHCFQSAQISHNS